MFHRSRQARRAAARRAAKDLRQARAAGGEFVVIGDCVECDCAICRAEAAGDGEAVLEAFADLLARAAAGDPSVFVEFGGDDDDDDDDDEGDDDDDDEGGPAAWRYDA